MSSSSSTFAVAVVITVAVVIAVIFGSAIIVGIVDAVIIHTAVVIVLALAVVIGVIIIVIAVAVVFTVAVEIVVVFVIKVDVFRSKQGIKFKLACGGIFSKCNFESLPQFNDLTGHGKSRRRLKETLEKISDGKNKPLQN